MWALKLSNSLCPCENLWFPESICSFSGQPRGFCDLKPLNEGGLSLYRANRALPGLPRPQKSKSVTISHLAVKFTRFQPQQRLDKVLPSPSEGSVGASRARRLRPNPSIGISQDRVPSRSRQARRLKVFTQIASPRLESVTLVDDQGISEWFCSKISRKAFRLCVNPFVIARNHSSLLDWPRRR